MEFVDHMVFLGGNNRVFVDTCFEVWKCSQLQ